jgi:hypothetical protein
MRPVQGGVACLLASLVLCALASVLAATASEQDLLSGLTHYADPLGAGKGRAEDAEEVILLRATFGHDGSATKIDVVRGKKRLVPTAISTVQRWRYHPGDADSVTLLIGVNVGRTTRGLNEAALDTVFRWQFEAGADPFPLEMTVVVNFRLD